MVSLMGFSLLLDGSNVCVIRDGRYVTFSFFFKNVSWTILLSMLGNHILDILILVSQSVNSEKLGVEL